MPLDIAKAEFSIFVPLSGTPLGVMSYGCAYNYLGG